MMYQCIDPGIWITSFSYISINIELKLILQNKSLSIPFELTLNWMPQTLMKSNYWFRWWPGGRQATSHYLNQCWPRTTSLDHNEMSIQFCWIYRYTWMCITRLSTIHEYAKLLGNHIAVLYFITLRHVRCAVIWYIVDVAYSGHITRQVLSRTLKS